MGSIVQGAVILSKVRNITENALIKPTMKRNARVLMVTKQVLIASLQNFDDDHVILFDKGALNRTTGGMLV